MYIHSCHTCNRTHSVTILTIQPESAMFLIATHTNLTIICSSISCLPSFIVPISSHIYACTCTFYTGLRIVLYMYLKLDTSLKSTHMHTHTHTHSHTHTHTHTNTHTHTHTYKHTHSFLPGIRGVPDRPGHSGGEGGASSGQQGGGTCGEGRYIVHLREQIARYSA